MSRMDEKLERIAKAMALEKINADRSLNRKRKLCFVPLGYWACYGDYWRLQASGGLV